MILSDDRVEISRLSQGDCKIAILERRKSIRNVRDQRGDDRCFLDDLLLWKWLADSPPEPTNFSMESGMEQCTLFYEHRRKTEVDSVPQDAILDPARWDDDLEDMTLDQLRNELVHIQESIQAHRDIKDRPRTHEDDQTLYSILPERIPADFRLPTREEFLGEARSPSAGCPAFWQSHRGCDTQCHNLHKWGPCRD